MFMYEIKNKKKLNVRNKLCTQSSLDKCKTIRNQHWSLVWLDWLLVYIYIYIYLYIYFAQFIFIRVFVFVVVKTAFASLGLPVQQGADDEDDGGIELKTESYLNGWLVGVNGNVIYHFTIQQLKVIVCFIVSNRTDQKNQWMNWLYMVIIYITIS